MGKKTFCSFCPYLSTSQNLHKHGFLYVITATKCCITWRPLVPGYFYLCTGRQRDGLCLGLEVWYAGKGFEEALIPVLLLRSQSTCVRVATNAHAAKKKHVTTDDGLQMLKLTQNVLFIPFPFRNTIFFWAQETCKQTELDSKNCFLVNCCS